MFTNKVNSASFEVGKEMIELIKKGKLTHELKEMREVAFY